MKESPTLPAEASIPKGPPCAPRSAIHGDPPLVQAKESSSESLKELQRLLGLALPDGSFAESPALRNILGISKQTLTTWEEDQWRGRGVWGVCDEVLVTALVLGLLRLRFSAEEDVWHQSWQKSISWLESEAPRWANNAIPDVDILITAAVARLPEQEVNDDVVGRQGPSNQQVQVEGLRSVPLHHKYVHHGCNKGHLGRHPHQGRRSRSQSRSVNTGRHSGTDVTAPCSESLTTE